MLLPKWVQSCEGASWPLGLWLWMPLKQWSGSDSGQSDDTVSPLLPPPRASAGPVFTQQPGGLRREIPWRIQSGKSHMGEEAQGVTEAPGSSSLSAPISSALLLPDAGPTLSCWFLPYQGQSKGVRKPTLEGDPSCHPDSALPAVWPWAKLLPLSTGSQRPLCDTGVIVSMANISQGSWECITPRAAQQHPNEVGTDSASSQGQLETHLGVNEPGLSLLASGEPWGGSVTGR